MDNNVNADFTINTDNNINAEYTLNSSEGFNCSFELFASGVTWGNIEGNIANQTDLQEALNSKQDVLTAGDNIQIINNVISATDTTYTAGTGISIENGVISNTQISAIWGNITGTLSDQLDLQNALDAKQDTISDLSTIRQNAQNGNSAYGTIQTYGNIVTHNTSEFATSAQGALADTALQPNDNISQLNNDAGYITSASLPTVNNGKLTIQVNGTDLAEFTANQSENTTANIVVPDSATWGNITGTLSDQTDLQNALNTKPTNNATGTQSIALGAGSSATGIGSIAYGYEADATSTYSTAIGWDALANNTNTIAIGKGAKASASGAIAIGTGSENSTASSLQVSTYQLLDLSNGLIPDARISSNIARTTDIPSLANYVTTNTAQTISASKAFSQPLVIADNNGLASGTILSNKKILQRSSGDNTLTLNNIDNKLRLIGSETRPKYSTDGTTFGDLALYSDIPTDYVPNTLTINGQALTSDITLTYSDVGALSSSTTINDLTTTAQQDALNSGANTTNIGQIATNTNDIITINGKIPLQATSSNQLADKNFVNSSIATNTANFIGTFNSVAELEAYSGTLTNNDYAFVTTADSAGNTLYDRYKYNADTQQWIFEYELNNSSFTAQQWASINSGITSGDVTLIGTALQPNDNVSSLVNDAGYITSSSIPTNYYTKSEIDAIIPQPSKVPIVYYQPTDSYCYTESNNRFYGSHVLEKLYLVQPKTSGTTQVIDMSTTFSLSFTIEYQKAPSSAVTVAEIITSYSAGKGVLLQLNSTGLYYRNNITGTTITGTRALTAGNSYDVRAEYDGTHMIISYKLSSDANYTQINSTTCTCDGSNYNYVAIGMNADNGNISLSSVVLTNGADTLYSYTAGKIALDYDNSTLKLNASNQLSVDFTGYATENFVTSQGYITSSALSNYVDLTSTQTITGTKKFSTISASNITNTLNTTILRTYAGNTEVGTTNTSLLLKSNLTRPYFNDTSTYLALYSDIPTNISSFTNDSGYITGIDSSDVTTALGYTPYDASNPNGYTSNIGTVTSVNNISPVSGNVTISIPTDTSDLTNGAGYITSSALSGYATETWVGNQGYITGITSSDVTTALGYTPYDSSNPNGYTSNVGTVTSVNNTNPDGNGNVSITIPTVNNATLTIQKNGTTIETFTANASSDVTANISVPTSISDLIDDTSTYPIDKAESVVDNNSGSLTFWSGTKAQYDAIATKDANTLYNITDDNTADAYEAYTKSEVDALIQDALYYKAGDTYTISSAIICPSFVTTSGTSIRFCIVTPKRLDNITTITCNTLITNFRKSDGGYVPSNLWNAKANATVNCNIRGSNMILVGVDYASGYGLTNNTPVGAEINSISLTFS